MAPTLGRVDLLVLKLVVFSGTATLRQSARSSDGAQKVVEGLLAERLGDLGVAAGIGDAKRWALQQRDTGE
jgi:hypothetical protein